MVYRNQFGNFEIFEKLTWNLLAGIYREILAHKERLPSRSRKQHYPTVLWALAPYHTNFPENWNMQWRRFNDALEKLVGMFPEMGILKLLKVWDYKDLELFSDHWFTARGLTNYWMSIDSAFRHWDTFVFTKMKTKHQTTENSDTTEDTRREGSEFICWEFNKYKKFQQRGRANWRNNRRLSRAFKFQDYWLNYFSV